jgi:hypothetical protein
MLGWEDYYKVRAILQSIWVCKEHYWISLYDYGCMTLLMSFPVFVGIETSASQDRFGGQLCQRAKQYCCKYFLSCPALLISKNSQFPWAKASSLVSVDPCWWDRFLWVWEQTPKVGFRFHTMFFEYMCNDDLYEISKTLNIPKAIIH